MALLALAGLAACCAHPAPLWTPPAEPTIASLYASHSDDGRFFNPWGQFEHGLGDLIEWQLFSVNEYAEARARPSVVPQVANDGSRLAARADDPSVTWIGHATALVEDGGDFWLTDPMFSETLPPFRHRLQAPGVALESIPAPAFVVVSHDHYDHLDLATIARLPQSTVVCVPLGIAELVRDAGHERVVELDWWQSTRVGDWFLTLLPAQHFSRRGAFGNITLWGSWLVEGHGRRYYFAGDTGYFHGFAEYGRRFGPIDVALLPIGAHAPRWFMQYVHMDPADALQTFVDLRARYLVPVHWGTFDLSDEPPDEPPRALRELVAGRPELAERVRILAIGETFALPPGAGDPLTP